MKDNQAILSLCLGRILRLASRPPQPGDIAEYERCRAIFMEAAENLGYDSRSSAPIGHLMPGWNFGNRSID